MAPDTPASRNTSATAQPCRSATASSSRSWFSTDWPSVLTLAYSATRFTFPMPASPLVITTAGIVHAGGTEIK